MTVADLVDRLTAAARAENAAAGERLAAIGWLETLRAREGGIDERGVISTANAVAAEVSAALTVSAFVAHSFVNQARAMRDRLPKVGELLRAGVISLLAFQTIAFRTDLIEDEQIMAAVDASLAARVTRWSTLTRGHLAGYIDKLVARVDRDAVRGRRSYQAQRDIAIEPGRDGLSSIEGHLFTTDAHALDARLDALAATVCDEDPRTKSQRRADALGALAVGADRLLCGCGRSGCPAVGTPAPSPVLLHVIAEQASLDGTGNTPGSLIGSDALIPPELLAELAQTARRRPLIHPGDSPPEAGYRPSTALADFVRCRDLTCRWPGCDKPAIGCDLDHTVAFADGGKTHASNLKALCREHHLAKTFLGWRDQQLPDGTVIWRAPSGHTYVTTPGSALLFPQLCAPTGDLGPPRQPPVDRCADRTAAIPKRRHTRAQNHARYVAAKRKRNREAREARKIGYLLRIPRNTDPDPDPPPF